MDRAARNRTNEVTVTSTAVEGDERVEFKLPGTFQQLPLSEIQTLAEQPRPSTAAAVHSSKRPQKIRLRGTRMASVNLPAQASRPKSVVTTSFPTSSHSPLVSEALALAASKGLRGGYIEFMRSNTDESIKRSFEEVKRELTNRQSFLKSATSVVRYLQAARILYNRLDWRRRRKYEIIARNRALSEHRAELLNKGVDDEMPLFMNESENSKEGSKDSIPTTACVMPPSEYIFTDQHSKEDIIRYEALESRRILCPLCPVTSDKITNTAHYQGHMLEHHSCAHFYACQFCGIVFPSLEALKTHDGCADFATALVQRISPSGDVELKMKYAIMLMACADCGSQLLISSTYIGESSIAHWDEIVKFHTLHNLEKVVPVVIYSEVELSQKVRLRVLTLTSIVKDVEVVCPHCGESNFDSVASLESHFETHEGCRKKRCPECTMQFCQEAFFREHLLSHLGSQSCYLAIHLSSVCTCITKGVSCCGPNAMKGGGGVVYGGVSSAIFTAKLSTPFVDAWESVTTKKKANRRGRKRRAGSAYKKDPDEVEAEILPADESSTKLRKILGDSFDSAGALKINGFFYTAIKSKDETVESSERYNGDSEYEFVHTEGEPETSTKLAIDISQKFTKYCRLAGGKPLSKKHNHIPSGLYSKVLMCRRCQCLCLGDNAMYAHLLKCCPDLRKDDDNSPPYDLDDGLLVLCVFAGNGVPNSRIGCWECSTTLCSIFGLRVHMAAYHGIFLRMEEESGSAGSPKRRPSFFSATTRSINLAIGLTEDGNLPVNLEERRKEALLAKLKSNDTFASSAATSSSCSPNTAISSPPKEKELAAQRVESPPVVILDCSPPSVQVIEYPEPPSVQVIDYGNQKSPNCIQHSTSEPSVQPSLEVGRQTQMDSHACSINGDPDPIAEANLIDEIDGLMEPPRATRGSEMISRSSASSQTNDSTLTTNENGNISSIVEVDPARASVSDCGQASAEVLKKSIQCEFCCLTMRSRADFEMHLKWHTEVPQLCYLCDPPCTNLERPELFLEHVKARHTLPGDPSKQDGGLYTVCAFCSFQVREDQLVVHLISDCYMAPCPICGDKLVRRQERTIHRKSKHTSVSERFVCECRRGFATITAFNEHKCRSKSVPFVSCTCCSAKFMGGAPFAQGKAMKDGVMHFVMKHTKNLRCLPCKNEPLEALSEHAQSHLKEESETCTPQPVLHSCSEIGLLNNTIEYPRLPRLRQKRKKVSISEAGKDEPSTSEATASSSQSRDSITMEEDSNTGDEETAQRGIQELDEMHQSENSNSRDGNSPSLLEKQRQVLAELIDSLGPPPSVIVLENGTAAVREEREDTPSAVPKSSVADDSDDEILIVAALKEPAQQGRNSAPSTASPVVHYVNEGDDDCMMLDVHELPTGVTSQSVSAQREKKFKCSMCSETFLRQSTCLYHEQNSHRNDIVSDICDEVYGVPLTPESLMYLCQQCAVAFEDQQRAHRHRAQHMVKAPAFPCEKCSSICLTDSNLRDHHKKHDEGKLSYRCLKCTPNKIYMSESAIFYHLYTEHSIPIIAFCKNCLLASANLDRIFSHAVYRECSGNRATNPRVSMVTILRSLGFAVASDLYFQPTDEKRHKQVEGRYAKPTLCSHRSFITFGDSFTTCPEDPSRCAALVNQNRWHSYLCATNKENPGEMPTNMPEGIFIRNVAADNMIDMLTSRFKFKERNRSLPPSFPEPSPCSSAVEAAAVPSVSQPLVDQRRQSTPISTCEVLNRRRGGLVEQGNDQPVAPSMQPAPQQMFPGGPPNDMPALRQAIGNMPPPLGSNQAACLLCRTRNVPMICEPTDRAYDAVNSLCTKFREVHPGAAQSLFSTLNAFIRDSSARRRVLYCFCRWHYPPQCFDSAGRPLLNMAPSQINSQILLDNYHNGLLYPDPASVAHLAPVPPSPSAGRPAIPAPSTNVAQPVVQRCVVCDLLPPVGPCKAASFYVDYMVAVPVNPVTLKEQWAMNICRYLSNPVAQEILNGFRLCHQPRLCLRHFNPRTVAMSPSGVLVRSPSCTNDLPILNFAQYAALNTEFNQALSKLLDGMEKCQNSNTIAMMLKIVQELVKCSDERCGRALNSSNDVRLHRFHQHQNKFVCMECFSTADVIRTEQEMIEHFALKHSQRNREGGENKIQVVYTLHCPLRNCNGAFPSVQMLRKHINHIHSVQFPMSSDNCATRFVSAAKMTFHNGVHEKHSCDVTCCYLCGVADPWQRELPGGLKISHELVHAMKRFVACKTCMAPMGQDPTGVVLIDHFMRQHMLDQPRRVRHCKVCRQNVIEPGIAEHILEQHRLVAFRPRYAPQSNMVSVMNGSELCVYLGLPAELCKPNPLADSTELG
uniref:C2H2-type domain-containing protein n=1 Tax=Haemonchus contortus TaxID=6289 RepID=A0A7I4YFG2_HAECO